MEPLRLAALVAAVTACLAAAPAQGPADVMTAEKFESKAHGTLLYRLFRPALDGEHGKLPLVLFLHGAGERGSDNLGQLQHGVGSFVTEAAQAKHPCFVVAPQCPEGRWWQVDPLLELAEAAIAWPGVDQDRVYVTGLSMGGYATWHLIGRKPDWFAAAVPVCGGGRVGDAGVLVHLPVWAFHGAADRVVAVGQSRAMIEAIRSAGGSPRYTEYPGVGHDSWTRTYADAAMHEWLFAQRRQPRAAAPVLRDGDRVVFLGDSITAAAVAEGGYIDVLARGLRERLPDAAVELIGAGISGNRVPDLLARLDKDVLAKAPTLVVVYIGINDVWHSQQGRGTPRADYERGLRELLDRLRAAKARALLCTPSVIGEKRQGANPLDAMLDDYAAVSREVAAAAGVQLLDLRHAFLEFLEKHNRDDADRGVLTTDGVHLNAAGNRFVAERLLEVLVR